MKILFCTYEYSDYGLDTLYGGLCSLLGPENVLEYPHKPTLHGVSKDSYLWYPPNYHSNTNTTDEEKLKMLESGEIDIILIGCRSDSGFWNKRREYLPYVQNALTRPIEIASKTIPTFFIDQGDYGDIKHVEKLMETFHAKLYFKREYLKNFKYPKYIKPLSLSYTPHLLSDLHTAPRTKDLFWAGRFYPKRMPYLDVFRTMVPEMLINNHNQGTYCRKLQMTKIALSLKGYGSDTVRYYEIPAYGAMLLSQNLEIKINHAFKDGETAVYFDTADDMVEKIHYYLNHDEEREKIRLAGQKWYRKYHSNEARAKQLLSVIKKTL